MSWDWKQRSQSPEYAALMHGPPEPEPPIHRAARKGDLERVQQCIAGGGPGVVHTHYQHWPPLFAAAIAGCLSVVKLLIEHGADIHYACREGYTALNHALVENHLDVAEVLMEKGASLGDEGYEYLCEAVGEGKRRQVELLLRYHTNVDPSTAPKTGQKGPVYCCGGVGTPLYRAALLGHHYIVKLLLDAGADPTVPTPVAPSTSCEDTRKDNNSKRQGTDGETPLQAAVRRQHQHCIDHLREWERAYVLHKARTLRDTTNAVTTTQAMQHSTAGGDKPVVAGVSWLRQRMPSNCRVRALPTVRVLGEHARSFTTNNINAAGSGKENQAQQVRKGAGRKRKGAGSRNSGSVAGGDDVRDAASDEVVCAVARQVVEGLSGEVFVELMGMVGITTGYHYPQKDDEDEDE